VLPEMTGVTQNAGSVAHSGTAGLGPNMVRYFPQSTRIGQSVRVEDCSFCDFDGFRTNSLLVRENELCLFASGNRVSGESDTLLRGSGIIVPKTPRNRFRAPSR
jgi:hypothetical protein